MLPLFTVIPLLTAFLIYITGRYIKKISDIFAVISSLTLVLLSFLFFIKMNQTGYSPVVFKLGGWSPPFGILMVADALSILVLIVVNIVGFMGILFSVSYMEKYTDKYRYFSLFMLMLSGMNGVIITGDMFNLFVFLEIGSIASYALVAYGTESEELEASFKYAVLGTVASMFILLGIAVLYSYTSTLNMADIAKIMIGTRKVPVLIFVSVLFITGFGLKSAIVPFHAWLPDAHPSAPAPISAMLSGVLIKSLGIYALVRVLFNVIGTG